MTTSRPLTGLRNRFSSSHSPFGNPASSTFDAARSCSLRQRNELFQMDQKAKSSLTRDVIALTFFADIDKREAFIRVFSSDRSMRTVPTVLPEAELYRLQPKEAGIWQATIPLSKDEEGSNTLFRVFYHFGFAIAL